MQNDQSQPQITSHDDNRVLRYLLHNVKGISAVSGGVMGDALEQEYQAAEEDFRLDSGAEFDY
ncbi:hypothetical protein HY312_00795 [Candidatus Saccharibacteria bacterium]|nr:hypothetical protein [Candidatus Saccharibacteria bacterium]